MRQDSAAEGGAILSRCVMGRVRGILQQRRLCQADGKNNARLFVGRCLLVFCLTFDS